MTSTAPSTATHPVPDSHGGNLYAADAELQALLPLYLPAPLFLHLQPHLQQLDRKSVV